jgi:hypothetical protein
VKYKLSIYFDVASDMEANSVATDIEQTLLAMPGDTTLLIRPVTDVPEAGGLGGLNDSTVVDLIASLMRHDSDWNADTLSGIADLIGSVREHPGDKPQPVPHAEHMWVPNDTLDRFECDVEHCSAIQPFAFVWRVGEDQR